MSKRKTRQQKERAENRRLREEIAILCKENAILRKENEELLQRIKILQENRMQNNGDSGEGTETLRFHRMYNVIVPAAIHAIVRWIEIRLYGGDEVPVLLGAFVILLLLLKNLSPDRNVYWEKIMQSIRSDLWSPFVQVCFGSALFALLAKSWCEKPYQHILDEVLSVTRMGVWTGFLAAVVAMVAGMSFITIKLVNRKNRR